MNNGSDRSADNRRLREDLVALFLSSGVFSLRDEGVEDGFVAGTADPSLDSLGIDSLSEVEICVGVEKLWGVSLSPLQLRKLGTLNKLERIVAKSAQARLSGVRSSASQR